MSNVDTVMAKKAFRIKEIWSDVDGVMTTQGGVTFCAVRNPQALESVLGVVEWNGRRAVEFMFSRSAGDQSERHLVWEPDDPVLELYTFKTQDGLLIERVGKQGLPFRFISGRDALPVRRRAETLGAAAFLGKKDKLSVISEQITHTGCSLGEIIFVGDGIQDVETHLAVKKAGGITIAPADASEEAKNAAEVVTQARGGEGVIYEALQSFMRVRGLWHSS